MAINKDEQKKTIGILSKGKNGQYIENDFSGVDVGIQDEGEDTFAKGNKFNTVGRHKDKWYQVWWGQIIIGLIILLVGGFLLFKLGWN